MQKKFAEGLCFKKIFIYFLIGSIFGVFYEEILHFIKHGYWESRSGLLYGPFNPVYGFGVAVVIGIFGKNIEKRKWYILFFECALLGGIVEYVMNYCQELFFNTRSWDYSNHLWNINGRTTIPIMIFWGMLGVIVLKSIYLPISYYIEKIPYNIGNIIFYMFLIFISIDILISSIAAYRQTERRKGISPKTFIGEMCDKIYTDEYLSKVYTNAVYGK